MRSAGAANHPLTDASPDVVAQSVTYTGAYRESNSGTYPKSESGPDPKSDEISVSGSG